MSDQAITIAQTSQVVQGFQRLLAGRPGGLMVSIADFRGSVQGWVGDLWWQTGTKRRKEELEWETATCPEARTTDFVFTANMSLMPYGMDGTNQARLLVNGEVALTFELGLKAPLSWSDDYTRVWSEGDFSLEFVAKMVQSPFEGYHRQFNLRGVSGLFRLTVPAHLIHAGEPLRLGVELLPTLQKTTAWFAILERTDSGLLSLESLAQEVQVLQRENIRLREMLNALAQKVYPEFFPERLAHEHKLLFSHGRNWVGVPDIQRLHNGDLFLSFRESSEHMSNDGMICTVRSSDGGKSWGNYQVIAADVGTDYRDVSVAQLRNGTLLMTWFKVLSNNEETGERLPDRPADPSQVKGWRGPNQVLYCLSFDQGYSWSKVYAIDPAPFLWSHTVEPCLELPTGRILMPIYTETAERRLAVVCYGSDDGGYSWRYLSTVLTRPEDGRMQMEYLETSLALTGSGKVIAISRTEADGMWQTISHDLGQSWDAPKQLPFPPNTQPSLLRLHDGRLLLCYGNRRTAPRSIHAHLSSNDGHTWGEALVLRDDLPNRDIGYACSVELEPGQLLTVYWANMFDRFALCGTFWRLPE